MAELNDDLIKLISEGKIADALNKLKGLDASNVLQTLTQIAHGLDKSKDNLDKFAAACYKQFKVSKESADLTTTAINNIYNAIKSAKASVEGLITESATVFKSINEQISEFATKYGGQAAEIGLMIPKALKMTGESKVFNVLGQNAKDATADIKETTESLIAFTGINPSGTMAGLFRQYLNKAQEGKNMEAAIISQAAAMGRLSEVYDQVGEELNGLTNKSERYAEFAANIGTAVGLAPSQISEAINSMAFVPGVLDNIGESSEIAGKQTHFFQAALEVASGTGQSYKTVGADLTSMYEKFGTKGEEALEIIARTQETADKTGVYLKNVKAYVNEASNAFQMLGNNAQGAMEVFNDIAPALKDIGAGPEQIQKITTDMVTGISKMSTAQKAFLSASTGGPSGLRGAFEINYQLAQGNLSEVYDKVKQNLKQQLGGPMVTLDQARSSDEAAAQMQKQISFLKSSSLGGMAQNDESAMKLIEAMAKEQNFGSVAKELKTPQEALRDSMDKGAKIQARNTTVITKLTNEVNYASSVQSLLANTMARTVLRSTDVIRKDRERAAGMAGTSVINGTGSAAGRNNQEASKEAFSRVVGSLGAGKDVVGNMVQSMIGLISGAKETVQEDIENQKERRKINPTSGKKKEKKKETAEAVEEVAEVAEEMQQEMPFLPRRRAHADVRRAATAATPEQQPRTGVGAGTGGGGVIDQTKDHSTHTHVTVITCAKCSEEIARKVVNEQGATRERAGYSIP